MRARDYKLAIELTNLLLVDEPLVGSAGTDNIVLSSELNHGALSGQSLLTQFAQAILQPNACSSRCFKLALKLISDVLIGHRVGDVRCTLRVERLKA